jgi:hypothetical protein
MFISLLLVILKTHHKVTPVIAVFPNKFTSISWSISTVKVLEYTLSLTQGKTVEAEKLPLLSSCRVDKLLRFPLATAL